MARYTFVTESHALGDEKKTVEILSRSEIRAIVEDCFADMQGGIDEINDDKQKLWDILDQFKPRPPHGTKSTYEKTVREFRDDALAAAKDAAEAKEGVERLVETARETFREIIAELLAPHYRFLAQHLGIELPVEMAKPMTKKRPVFTQNPSAAISSVNSPLSAAKPKKKTARQTKSVATEENSTSSPKRKTASASKKPVAKKKSTAQKKPVAKKKPETAVPHPPRKGAKPCPKK